MAARRLDPVGRANKYISDVLSGRRPACVFERQACQRQKNDLKTPPKGYRFDPDFANRACQFIELLPHIKGKWARERKLIELEGWQCFIITTVFGWVDVNNLRRFKQVYEEVPRKNAKSTKLAGIGLYLLSADNEAGAEVYSAATTRDQAKLVWRDAKRMVEKTPGLKKHFGVETLANSIFIEETDSFFKTVARDQGGNLDGYNVHAGLIDELHAHKTRDVYDVIETGTGSRDQPLIWNITTAGFNKAGICYEVRDYAKKVLSGAVSDFEFFGIIYTVDEDDDPFDPATWQKANPNWGISVNPDDIARKARKAQETPSAVNNFLTKHLNIWVNADTAWLRPNLWESRGNPKLDLDDFEGYECFIALDAASKIDITSKVYLFPPCEISPKKWTLFAQHWLPEDAVEESRNSQYSGWEREGRILTTDGSVIDLDEIEESLREDAERFKVREFPYDPFQLTQMSVHLANEGLPMVELGATVKNFSEPMKELEAMLMNDTIQHDGCPVMAWMASNVVCHIDKKDNIFPNKEFPQNKIDGVVAAIMALARGLFSEEDKPSVYEDRGVRTL